MADKMQDIFDIYAFITVDCQCTSSQEELLSHARFAREEETLPDDGEPPSTEVDVLVENRRKLDEFELGRRRGGEIEAGGVNKAGDENLGFGGERKRGRGGESSGTKLEGNLREEREIEPHLKKSRVSPLVHCSGKVVIEGGDEVEKLVEFSGDLNLKVEVASSSRSIVVPESVGCTEKLNSDSFDDDVGVEGEVKGENEVKKNPEFVTDTEVMINEEKGNVDEDKGEGRGEGKVRGDEEGGEGTRAREEEVEGGTSLGKRELPLSMFGLICAEGSEDGNVEGGLKEISEEGKRDGKFKGSSEDGLRCILDVLRVLASEGSSDDDNEVDIFETAKRRGMTFPRSRFVPEVE